MRTSIACLFNYSRNPRECAVAKQQWRNAFVYSPVATRTNALWQSQYRHGSLTASPSQPARMRCGKEPPNDAVLRRDSRNPRECAVAKKPISNHFSLLHSRNPHECAVAKLRQVAVNCLHTGRNPHECAVTKSRHCCARTGNSENMNHVLHF